MCPAAAVLKVSLRDADTNLAEDCGIRDRESDVSVQQRCLIHHLDTAPPSTRSNEL
jgi:hypothetical protein